jgi:SAM-dependent methyltransferase
MEPRCTDTTNAYWIEHAATTAGLAAIYPRNRWLAIRHLTRRMLQAWTLSRARGDRRRYRKVVDIGCGHGDWSELFAPIADEVYACDVAPAFVEQTRSRLARHRAVRVDVSDVRGYAIPDGADLVYLGAVLMYLDDDAVIEVLRRIRRAVAPGAHVIVRDWCAFNLGRHMEYDCGDYFSIHRRPEELRSLAEQVGLQCLEIRSSPSIYAEVLSRWAPLAYPLRILGRVIAAPFSRASHTLRFRRW